MRQHCTDDAGAGDPACPQPIRALISSPELAFSGGLALVANLSCLFLWMRHRADDLNMRSTWLSFRNDVMANVGVLGAAAGVTLTGAAWPDILIGVLIAGLFLSSAWGVIRDALLELRFAAKGPVPKGKTVGLTSRMPTA